ncbi:ABC transporter permease [Nocardioides pelophilus]|uniref:ABC transporter permease n=1 Tax=Nocardioides pelophilus TaxID=2172019 RepID=UPI0015FEBAF0|nr:ABC transporter permease subunit [Nocardioides pelophilus]
MIEAIEFLLDGESWTRNNGLLEQLVQQLLLTFTALALAVAVGLPIALWLGHLGRGGLLAINISNIGRAVPTFALLAVLVRLEWPGNDPFGPYGRAGLATLVALLFFALPPIITQAYVGVREVDDGVRESARGMGMSGAQLFWRVELPLALPLVVSGVRLALVQVWATATIASLVGGPGLGNVIQLGFANLDRRSEGIAGAILVALIALVLELAAALVQRAVNPVPRSARTASSDQMSVLPPTVNTAGDPVG